MPLVLSAKETTMLTAVVSLMAEVPSVDFDQVAKMCGVKYGRNARASCKSLFEKIKANACLEGFATANAAENGDEASTPKKRKSPVKNTAGTGASLKTASPKKPRTGSKQMKKEDVDDIEEGEIHEDADEESGDDFAVEFEDDED